MANLTRSQTFHDLLVSIELKLVTLQWIEISRAGNTRRVFVRERRLIDWAVACCEKAIPLEIVEGIAGARSPEQQWWALRQLLPEAALIALDGKLDIFLQELERQNKQG